MALSEHVTAVILQVTVLVVGIACFFFIYGTHIEEQVVKTQVDRLVSSFTEDATVLLRPGEKQSLQDFMANIPPPANMDAADAQAAENNRKLLKKSVILIGGLFITGIIVTLIMGVHYRLNPWSLAKHSFLGVIACLLTEYVFLTYYAAKYHSLDANSIKKSIIEALQTYANS